MPYDVQALPNNFHGERPLGRRAREGRFNLVFKRGIPEGGIEDLLIRLGEPRDELLDLPLGGRRHRGEWGEGLLLDQRLLGLDLPSLNLSSLNLSSLSLPSQGLPGHRVPGELLASLGLLAKHLLLLRALERGDAEGILVGEGAHLRSGRLDHRAPIDRQGNRPLAREHGQEGSQHGAPKEELGAHR